MTKLQNAYQDLLRHFSWLGEIDATSTPSQRAVDLPSQEDLALHSQIEKYASIETSVATNEVSALKGSALARYIDHTLLKADATPTELARTCHEAREHQFATVCMNGAFVRQATPLLEGSNTLPIAVIGFPLGAGASHAKAAEAKTAVADGAREIDMVIATGLLKAKMYQAVLNDIRSVVAATKPYPVKVILETCLLDRTQKIAACVLAKAAGAAFVKTSTGFSTGGATVEDIALMRAIVGSEMGVKASGGIRTRADALKMIAAGANRIGASASVNIVQDSQTTPTSGY